MKKIVIPILLLVFSCTTAQQKQELPQQPASYSARFAPMPTEIDFCGERVPLEYADIRESLQRELIAIMNMHSTTLQTLSRTTRYFPVIVPILKEYGIPEDFKYLAMTESSLNPNAASGAGARGMWQFLSAAAKENGLETGSNVDMRYHVEASTRAACKYLKKAYAKFGSWTMAAASYNCGMAGVSNRQAKQGGITDYYDLFLPEETMRYVFHIIGYKIVTPEPAAYGFDIKSEDYHKEYKNIKEIKVNDAEINWSKLAADHGTNYRILRILNPWIRNHSYTNKSLKTYTVVVPVGDFRKLGH